MKLVFLLFILATVGETLVSGAKASPVVSLPPKSLFVQDSTTSLMEIGRDMLLSSGSLVHLQAAYSEKSVMYVHGKEFKGLDEIGAFHKSLVNLAYWQAFDYTITSVCEVTGFAEVDVVESLTLVKNNHYIEDFRAKFVIKWNIYTEKIEYLAMFTTDMRPLMRMMGTRAEKKVFAMANSLALHGFTDSTMSYFAPDVELVTNAFASGPIRAIGPAELAQTMQDIYSLFNFTSLDLSGETFHGMPYEVLSGSDTKVSIIGKVSMRFKETGLKLHNLVCYETYTVNDQGLINSITFFMTRFPYMPFEYTRPDHSSPFQEVHSGTHGVKSGFKVSCATCDSGSYNDGCNDCTCNYDGSVTCTQMHCFFEGFPTCLASEPKTPDGQSTTLQDGQVN